MFSLITDEICHKHFQSNIYAHTTTAHTWESYIKALIAHGKVWYEAKLHTEIPK